MAHGEASGGPVLPPQRRSLQQRFGPHARARDGRGTVRRLLALYARWGRELLLVVCLTLLSTGAALAVPYLLGRAVDCFLPWGGVERAALSVLLPTLAGAAAAQWLGNWGRRRWMEILSQRMVARIRRECFAKLGRLPLSYFDRHPHGDTMGPDGLERRPGQAVLHITQKVRAARTADRILVLEEGRQVGLGTHRSLLDTCPTYREIWASQAPEEEGEDGTR